MESTEVVVVVTESFWSSALIEAAFVAHISLTLANSLVRILFNFLTESLPNTIEIFLRDPIMVERVAIAKISMQRQSELENKDAEEDGDEDDDDDYAEDESEQDYEDAGEEEEEEDEGNADEEGDPEDAPEANGDGGSEEEDEEDEAEDDENDDEEDEEEEEEDEEEIPQPPAKRRK